MRGSVQQIFAIGSPEQGSRVRAKNKSEGFSPQNEILTRRWLAGPAKKILTRYGRRADELGLFSLPSRPDPGNGHD